MVGLRGRRRVTGHGQGRVPAVLARQVRSGRVYAAGGEELARALEALPDPQVRRPDPTYRLLAFTA